MEPVALIFLLACVGALVASARSGSATAQVLALMLAMVFAYANLLWLLDGMGLLALMDVPVAFGAYVAWYEQRQRWQAWCAAIYGARLALHPMYALGLIGTAQYLHTINALFLAALVAVSWRGGVDDLAALGRRGLRRCRLFLAQGPREAVAAATREVTP